MKLDLEIDDATVLTIVEKIEMRLSEAMAELEGGIDEIGAQIDKSKAEIMALIADLQTQVADPVVDPAAIQAKFSELKARVQGVDDIVPDVVTPPV